MKDYLLILVSVDSTSGKDGIETGTIFSKPASQQYATGWEAVFGKAKTDGEIAHSKSLN
jgi:hypothetical protein